MAACPLCCPALRRWGGSFELPFEKEATEETQRLLALQKANILAKKAAYAQKRGEGAGTATAGR